MRVPPLASLGRDDTHAKDPSATQRRKGKAPHPAAACPERSRRGHPHPKGEGSRRKSDSKTRSSFVEILLPPGEGARSADEGRENIHSTLMGHSVERRRPRRRSSANEARA